MTDVMQSSAAATTAVPYTLLRKLLGCPSVMNSLRALVSGTSEEVELPQYTCWSGSLSGTGVLAESGSGMGSPSQPGHPQLSRVRLCQKQPQRALLARLVSPTFKQASLQTTFETGVNCACWANVSLLFLDRFESRKQLQIGGHHRVLTHLRPRTD